MLSFLGSFFKTIGLGLSFYVTVYVFLELDVLYLAAVSLFGIILILLGSNLEARYGRSGTSVKSFSNGSAKKRSLQGREIQKQTEDGDKGN